MNWNKDIPPFQCYVRNEFLFNQEKGHGEHTQAWVFAVRSIKGQALQFYALLETGAMFTGLPIHAFTFETDATMMDLGEHQLWDNLSYNIDVIQFTFLKYMTCKVLLKNKRMENGYYLFSVDFAHPGGFGLAETPNEWKGLHIIALDNGNIVAYPPNRILFQDAALIDPNVNVRALGYKVNTTLWSCEDGNKFSVGSDDSYLYKADTEDN